MQPKGVNTLLSKKQKNRLINQPRFFYPAMIFLKNKDIKEELKIKHKNKNFKTKKI